MPLPRTTSDRRIPERDSECPQVTLQSLEGPVAKTSFPKPEPVFLASLQFQCSCFFPTEEEKYHFISDIIHPAIF